MALSPRSQPELRTRFSMLHRVTAVALQKTAAVSGGSKAKIAFLRSILSHRRCAPFLFGFVFFFYFLLPPFTYVLIYVVYLPWMTKQEKTKPRFRLFVVVLLPSYRANNNKVDDYMNEQQTTLKNTSHLFSLF